MLCFGPTHTFQLIEIYGLAFECSFNRTVTREDNWEAWVMTKGATSCAVPGITDNE